MNENVNKETEKRDGQFIQGDSGGDIKKIYEILKEFSKGLDDLDKRLKLLEI